MRHHPTAGEHIIAIIHRYESGLSMMKVPKQFGVSPRTAFNYLRERGVSMRDGPRVASRWLGS